MHHGVNGICVPTMGVGRIFSSGGPKVVKFGFYPSKLKKQPSFANNFKIQGGQGPPFPTPMIPTTIYSKPII